MSDRLQIALEVLQERLSQDGKWGEQNHPDGTGRDCLRVFSRCGASADGAKHLNAALVEAGQLTFAAILWEEVAEVLEETDPARLRAELIQVAAVAQAWAEAIDRRGAK